MAYVGFKRGPQANLNTILNDINSQSVQDQLRDGYFYLTSDTDRLYVCREDPSTGKKTLVELNKSITIVASFAALSSVAAAEGQFYYVTQENVLCVYRNGAWRQINPDHRIANTTSNTSVSNVVSGSNVIGAKVRIEVQDDDQTSPNTSSGEFQIIGGSNISVTRVDNTITIDTPPGSDTLYDLTSDAITGGGATITLANRNTGTAHEEDTISIVGSNDVTVSESNGTITITGPNRVAATSTGFNASGVLTVSTDVDGVPGTVTSTATPTIAYGKDSNGQPTVTDGKFLNGTATLDVYTAGQVDAKIDEALSAADAMTYRGVIENQAGFTAITSAKKGDTYKLGTDNITINGNSETKTGDLIIYKGEDTDATHPYSAAQWEIVPSGNDQVITVDTTAANNKIDVKDNGVSLGSLALTAGTKMTITSTKTGTALVTTIDQKQDYTAQTATGSATNVTQVEHTDATFTAVTGIATDAYGNVVNGSVKTATFTVKDTHANVNAVTINATKQTDNGDVQSVNIETKVEDTDNTHKEHSYKLASASLSMSVTQGSGTNPDTIAVNLEWGSF